MDAPKNPPLTQAELEALRERARKGLPLWPKEKPKPDIDRITREIARGG